MSVQIIIDGATAADVLNEMERILGTPAEPPVAQAPEADTQPAKEEKAVTEEAPATTEPVQEKPKRGRKSKKTEEPTGANITDNPEDRVNPQDDAQDAADERAEEESSATEALTHDDVREAASGYIAKFGMEAASVDLIGCLEKAVGVKKMSQIPDDQESLAKAVAAFQAASKADKRYGQ